MVEMHLKSILYDRTVDYASRMVKNEGVMNFMKLNGIQKMKNSLLLLVGKRNGARLSKILR